MFALAYSLGIYSYVIFLLGLLGILYTPLVIVVTMILLFAGFFYLKNSLSFAAFFKKHTHVTVFSIICLSLLLSQIVINLIGTLGPEIGFDALWYHLTFPKLYLTSHALMHIPGGLLYYSDMRKLVEMMYTGVMAFGSSIFAKLLHFAFGILTCIALYKLARKYLSQELSILTVLIFYTNLVVGWESVSAYVDLARGFFEICALWAFLEWHTTKDKKMFIASALLIGLAVATKLVALASVLLYILILLFIELPKLSFIHRVKRAALFAGLALLVPFPWFVFAFIYTGNPFYPVFSSPFSNTVWVHLLNPFFLLVTLWTTFTHAPDPISPIYIASIPLFIAFRKQLKDYSLLLYFSLGFLVSWIFLPQSGEARFLIPYLPLFSLVVVILLSRINSLKVKIPLFGFIFVTIFISLMYRGIANAKFIPVIMGKQTQANFLSRHLNFSYGDFADIDGYFAHTIKSRDTVLLYGFHNLYYVDFPFIDSSWVKSGDMFDYVAVQGIGMPDRFRYWDLVYFNNTTHVRLYSLKGQTWYY